MIKKVAVMADEDLKQSLERVLKHKKIIEWEDSWEAADIVILECCYPEYNSTETDKIYSGIRWVYILWAKRLAKSTHNQLEPEIIFLSHDCGDRLIEVLKDIGLLDKNETVQLPSEKSLKIIKIPFCLMKLVKTVHAMAMQIN